MTAGFTQLADAFAKPSLKKLREWDISTSTHYQNSKFHVVIEYFDEVMLQDEEAIGNPFIGIQYP